MKNRIVAWLGVGLLLTTTAGVARADLINGSFESWNLLGWNFYSDTGLRVGETTPRVAGVAQTESVWGNTVGLLPSQTALDGNRFLLMRTRPAANFVAPGNYSFHVSQSFTLNPGDSVFGLAAFWGGNGAQADQAWVRILDANLNVVATPWGESVSQSAMAAAGTTLDWSLWQWESVAGGQYTLQLGMSTSAANNNASFALFDGVGLGNPASIPEPSSFALGLLGGIALLVARYRQSR